METVASWTKSLCSDVSQGRFPNQADNVKSLNGDQGFKFLSSWSVLDIGTGNGLLLQELAKEGYVSKFCFLILANISERFSF